MNFDKQQLGACVVGKTRIETDDFGRPIFVKRGRMEKCFCEAVEYIDSHKPLKDALASWMSWRKRTIDQWKHETQHFRYSSNGGALAVRLNGNVVIRIGNGVGDGDFPVYVNPAGEIPPTFRNTGLSIDGPCAIELLNYDYGESSGVTYNLHKGDMMFVFRDNEGAIVMKSNFFQFS